MKYTDKTIALTIDTTKEDIKEALEYIGGEIHPSVFDMCCSLLSFDGKTWHSTNNFQYGDSLISILAILKEARIDKQKENQFINDKAGIINRLYGRHRINYLKWNITEDLSLRYFFTFQDRKEYEGQFVIKSHSEKKYLKLDSKTKIDYIFNNFVNKENFTQVIGKNTKGTYRKLLIDKDSIYATQNDKLKMFYLNEQNIPDEKNV